MVDNSGCTTGKTVSLQIMGSDFEFRRGKEESYFPSRNQGCRRQLRPMATMSLTFPAPAPGPGVLLFPAHSLLPPLISVFFSFFFFGLNWGSRNKHPVIDSVCERTRVGKSHSPNASSFFWINTSWGLSLLVGCRTGPASVLKHRFPPGLLRDDGNFFDFTPAFQKALNIQNRLIKTGGSFRSSQWNHAGHDHKKRFFFVLLPLMKFKMATHFYFGALGIEQRCLDLWPPGPAAEFVRHDQNNTRL